MPDHTLKMQSSTAELFLVISMILSIFQCISPFLGLKNEIYRANASIMLILILTSFLLLMKMFVESDFSVLLVANHSHLEKPLLYKIAATWANHEGSILMWVLVLSAFNALIAFVVPKEHREFGCYTLSIHGFIIALFIGYVIYISNPFVRIFPVPNNGLGLNPLLQDIGLALHPPTLYLGYVGFSVSYAMGVGSLFSDISYRQWSKIAMPFALISWMMLTIGILLGSWWAYRELGWGGYWFWDPVENASLIPWLSGAALIHSLNFNASNKHLYITRLISILTFSLTCVGTFLVRSGAITSIHSFASDPKRGAAILAITAILMIGGLLALAVKSANHKIHQRKGKKEIVLLISAISFLFLSMITLIGTIYPIISQMINNYAVTISPQYYIRIFQYMLIFMLTACIYYSSFTKKLWMSSIILIATFLFVYCLYSDYVLSLFASLCVTLIALNILEIYWCLKKRQFFKISSTIGHCGFGLLILSILLNSYFSTDYNGIISVGKTIKVDEYQINMVDVVYEKVDNYFAKKALIQISSNNQIVGVIKPEIRFYYVEKKVLSEVDVMHFAKKDIYCAITDSGNEDEFVIKFCTRPFIFFIWFSGFLIGFSAFFSLIWRVYGFFIRK